MSDIKPLPKSAVIALAHLNARYQMHTEELALAALEEAGLAPGEWRVNLDQRRFERPQPPDIAPDAA